MKPEVEQFVEEMLRQIRREFLGKNDKRFYQERSMLIEAITWPAIWMDKRGARMPASGYRRILRIVIGTIKRHGNQVKFRRFSLYLFKAVQEHMDHHGEEYYYQAKVRPIGAIVPAVARDVRPGRARDSVTETLSQMNKVLRSRGGRRRRDSIGQLDLLTALHPSRSSKAL
jgi:hypothetical protein